MLSDHLALTKKNIKRACPHTASSYTVGPQAYQVTVLPSGSKGTNAFLLLVKLLYMDNFGSLALAASVGAGGGVHSGIAAAIFAAEGWYEALVVAERESMTLGRQKLRRNRLINLRR